VTPLPVATPRETWRVVWDLTARRKRALVAALSTLVLGTAVGLLAAPLLGRVVDVVTGTLPREALVHAVVGLALVAVVSGAATAVAAAQVARLGEAVLADLRERFVGAALGLPQLRVEAAGAGDLTSRASRDVGVVAEGVRVALPTVARSAVTIVLSLAGMALLDWRFLVAGLLAAPVQWHTVRWYARNARVVYAAQREAVAELQQQLLETVEGARTVRAFGLRQRHLGRVDRRSASAIDLGMRGATLLTRFFSRLNLAEFVGLAAVLGTGFWLVGSGEVTIGAATAAALYFHGIFNPVNAALGLADDVQLAAAALSRLVGLPDAPTPPGAERTGDASVTVAGVHFGYNGEAVLHGVDLAARPGEHIAVVGANGAGKTTLARLVAGVAPPDAGTVSAGAVYLVSQEVHVFAGTVAEDLRLVRPDAAVEDLRAALAAVGALAWVDALPDGLDTVVGEGGHRLTAAEGQHLALARVVLADPPVVVLDEATAEAGSAGARVLERAAAAALAGRTALVVAHRLTQAAVADRVVVLDGGKVVETGSHADLLAARGRYADLWAAWSAARPRDDTARG
jgi:ATP-binding cassette subfamily C protein